MLKFNIKTKEYGSKFIWAHTSSQARRAYAKKISTFHGDWWELTEWTVILVRRRTSHCNRKLWCQLQPVEKPTFDYDSFNDFVDNYIKDCEAEDFGTEDIDYTK